MPTSITKFMTGFGCLAPVFAVGFFIYSIGKGFGFVGFILAALFGFAGIMILGQSQIMETREKEKQKAVLLSLMNDQANLRKAPSVTSVDLLTRVAADYDNQRLYIWFAEDFDGKVLKKPRIGMPYRMLNFAFKDLSALAFVEDEFIISACGATEEIPGASTHLEKRPIDKVKKMALVLKLNHPKHAIFYVNFFDKPYTPLMKNLPEYEAHLKEGQKWYERLATIIEQPKPVTKPKPAVPLAKAPSVTVSESAPVKAKAPAVAMANDPTPATAIGTVSGIQLEVASQVPMPVIPEASFEEKSERKKAKIEKSEPEKTESAPPERNLPEQAIEPKQDSLKQEEAELSYFDRLVAENRRQLREPPAKKK